MAWRQFDLRLGELEPDAVEAIFERFGASSITYRDAGNDPVLEPGAGETPLWSNTTISGLFMPDADLDALQRALVRDLGLTRLPRFGIETLEDRQWEREWLKDFGPMQFGQRLWVCPKGSDPNGHDAVVVRLDPGLAFGTGTHATTALCLEWLDGLSLSGKNILDYGCGSGILAIAALKLGCDRAMGMDIDPQAVTAARQNARDNAVAGKFDVIGHAADISGDFDVVIANILASPLVQFAESVTSTLRQGGMLGLSGVLCEQADDVMAAYEAWIDFDAAVFREQDGQVWSRLTGKRRAG